VMQILDDVSSPNYASHGSLRRGRRNGHVEGLLRDSTRGSLLQTAAKAIQEFLPEANLMMEVEPFDVLEATTMPASFIPSSEAIAEAEKVKAALLEELNAA